MTMKKKSAEAEKLDLARQQVALQREDLALKREQLLTEEMRSPKRPGVKEWRAAACVFALLLMLCEVTVIHLALKANEVQQQHEKALQFERGGAAITQKLLKDEHQRAEILAAQLKKERKAVRILSADLRACHAANPKWATGAR